MNFIFLLDKLIKNDKVGTQSKFHFEKREFVLWYLKGGNITVRCSGTLGLVKFLACARNSPKTPQFPHPSGSGGSASADRCVIPALSALSFRPGPVF